MSDGRPGQDHLQALERHAGPQALLAVGSAKLTALLSSADHAAVAQDGNDLVWESAELGEVTDVDVGPSRAR